MVTFVSRFSSRQSRQSSFKSINWTACLPLASIIVLFWVYASVAQSSAPTPLTAESVKAELDVALDSIWVMIAAFLVFFMNAGFAMVEAGFCRRKNAVNILAKNLIVFGLATVAFWSIGFALMFGDGLPFIGTNGFFLSGVDNSPATAKEYSGIFSSLSWATIPLEAKFFFQLVF